MSGNAHRPAARLVADPNMDEHISGAIVTRRDARQCIAKPLDEFDDVPLGKRRRGQRKDFTQDFSTSWGIHDGALIPQDYSTRQSPTTPIEYSDSTSGLNQAFISERPNMHERFSDRARHAMALANLEAGNLGHNFLAPGHIMLGLIAEGECVATEALRLLDVDLDRVRERVAAQMEKPLGITGFGIRAQTVQTKEVIAMAIEEARRLGHRYVGTEHLVLALLQQPDGLPNRVLKEQGVDLTRLREKVLAIMPSKDDPSHDLAHSRHGDFEWVHQQELAKVFRSQKFWHTMILAVDAANRMGDGEVEPHHLLLALLRDESTQVAKLLNSKGVTSDLIREKVTNGATVAH